MTVATMEVRPSGSALGAEAIGVDLREADAGSAERLNAALLDNLVLCVRDQSLEPVTYVKAAEIFGRPALQVTRARRLPEAPEVGILSSEDRDVHGDGRRIVAGAHWHTDDSYKAVPCSVTMLYGVKVPSRGGDTQFVNMYAAWEALPAEMRARLEDLKVVHMYDSPRKGNYVFKRTAEEEAETPDVVHPLVRTHPETGRKALYLNPNRMSYIQGMDREESDRLLDELIAHATQERFQYRHRWRQGDLLLWDNRCTMHKANADYPEGEPRLMHRILLEGTAPY